MNWADIRLLYVRELRSALRERSIVVTGIVIPIVLYPALIWLAYTGFSFVSGQLEVMQSRVMLRGLPPVLADLRSALEGNKQIALVESRSPEQDLRVGKLDVLVDFDAARQQGASRPNYTIKVLYDASRDQSSLSRRRVLEAITEFRTGFINGEAARLGLSESLEPFWIDAQNVSTGLQMGQFILGLLLPLMLVIMLAVGGVHPAVDATAGERENSTWETTITMSTPRINVVVAKYLYVATMSLVAGLLNLVAMMLSVRSLLAPMLGENTNSLSFQIPLRALPVMILAAALLALFVAAGMMILASFARTFKEGQSMTSPFYIAMFLPITLLQSTGSTLTPALALVPIVNVTLVYREAIAGTFQWPLIGLTLASEVFCVGLALWLARNILQHEDFVLGSYGGNLRKFLVERLLKRA